MIIAWFAVVFIVLLVAVSFTVLLRRIIRQRRRAQLRLLRDRRRTLSQEIKNRSEELKCLDVEELAELRENAENAFDQIQLDIIARQNFLRNYEDLAFLQKHFIITLHTESKNITTQEIEPDSILDAEYVPPTREARKKAEDALLNQIKTTSTLKRSHRERD